MAPAAIDYRTKLAAPLYGQTIAVPNLLAIFSDWEIRKHPAIKESRESLEEWILLYVPTEKQRIRQRKIDTAFCAGHFWPRVPKEQFKVLVHFLNWLWLWDDEVDCGLLAQDTERTEACCNDSIAFLRSCLQPELNVNPPVPGRLHNCGPFMQIGKALMIGQDKVDRYRFAESIFDYMLWVTTSQAQWSTGVVSMEQYLKRRLLAAGVKPCLTIIPWAYGLKLPLWIWDHEATIEMIREVTMSVSHCNDICSLKTELEANDSDSIIPILVSEKQISAQEAVNEVISMMIQSWENYRAAGARLRQAAKAESKDIKRDINVFVDACTDLLVGNVVFSLHTPRYLANATFDSETGGFEITL